MWTVLQSIRFILDGLGLLHRSGGSREIEALAIPELIQLTVWRQAVTDGFVFTLLEDTDASGTSVKRGGELLRGDLFGTDDATFLPEFGKYVRDLARKHPNATMTFKVVPTNGLENIDE